MSRQHTCYRDSKALSLPIPDSYFASLVRPGLTEQVHTLDDYSENGNQVRGGMEMILERQVRHAHSGEFEVLS